MVKNMIKMKQADLTVRGGGGGVSDWTAKELDERCLT